MAGYVSDAVIRRLPGYYRHLTELEEAGVIQISSQELGKRMGLTPSQIRQDINCFGGFGRQGYGYRVSELREHIREILGIDQEHRMIIIGAGKIGRAVAGYPAFRSDGFSVLALFDRDDALIGRSEGGILIRDIRELETFLQGQPTEIAVLALPSDAAQETLDRLYAAGVRAVWNFAATDLQHPEDMLVVNVHLSDSLQILSYKMAHREA